MRKTCLACVRKHISQAMILVLEAEKDPETYGWHRFIACGHLAEAEDECVEKYPKLAGNIRKTRIEIEQKEADLSILSDWFEKKIKLITKKEGES